MTPEHAGEVEQRTRLDEASAELAAMSFAGMAASRAVRATVSGTGVLLDLAIARDALARPHPGVLGTEITEAVSNARGNASEVAGRRYARIMPGFFDE